MFVELKENEIEPIRKGKTKSYKHVSEPIIKMHVFIHMICQPMKSSLTKPCPLVVRNSLNRWS